MWKFCTPNNHVVRIHFVSVNTSFKKFEKALSKFSSESYIYGTEEMAKLFENSGCFRRGLLIESQYRNHGSRPSVTSVLGFPSPLLSSAIISW